MCLCSGKMWKSNVNNIFFSYHFPCWPVWVKYTWYASFTIAQSLKTEFRLEGVFEFYTPINTTWTLISSDHEFSGWVVHCIDLSQTVVSCSLSLGTYRLVSNIRCTSNIRRTPTLGNSQLEFSPTISLAKTSNTRRTPSFYFWVSIVDKVRSRPHMVRAAPSGLRFWLTVDQRTNDTLSVSAVCETCCSNTCCEALWVNCNRISFNRSKNTTQSSPIHRRQHHFVLTVKGPVWPRWPKISPCVTTKIMWNKTVFR